MARYDKISRYDVKTVSYPPPSPLSLSNIIFPLSLLSPSLDLFLSLSIILSISISLSPPLSHTHTAHTHTHTCPHARMGGIICFSIALLNRRRCGQMIYVWINKGWKTTGQWANNGNELKLKTHQSTGHRNHHSICDFFLLGNSMPGLFNSPWHTSILALWMHIFHSLWSISARRHNTDAHNDIIQPRWRSHFTGYTFNKWMARSKVNKVVLLNVIRFVSGIKLMTFAFPLKCLNLSTTIPH